MTPNEKTDGPGPASDEPLGLEAPALPSGAAAADPAASRTVLDRGPTRPLPESALDANETVDARFGDALDGHRTMDATLDANFDPSQNHTHDGGLQAEDRAALLAMRRALEGAAPVVRIVDPDPAPAATVIDPVQVVESELVESVSGAAVPDAAGVDRAGLEDGPEDLEPDEVGHGPAVVGVLPAAISTAPPDVGDKAEPVHTEPDRGAGDLRGDDTFDHDRKVTAALRGLVDKKGLQDTLDRGRHQLGITQDEDGLLDVLSSLEAALGGNSIVDNPFDDVGPTAGGSPAESPRPALHSVDPLDDVLSPKTPLPGSAAVLSAGVVPSARPAPAPAAPPALPTPAPKPAVVAPAAPAAVSSTLPDPDELELPGSKASAALELTPVASEVAALRGSATRASARPRSALELEFEDEGGALTSSVLDDLGALQAGAAAPPLSPRTPSMPTPILGVQPGPDTPALAPPPGAAPMASRAVSAPRSPRRASAEHSEATSSRPERRAVAPTRKGPGLWLGLAVLLIVLSIVLVAMSARR